MKKLGVVIIAALLLLTGCGSKEKSIKTVDVKLSESEPGVFVEAIGGLSDDFILGCDISTIISEEQSGVVYYNNEGEEQDMLLTLAENGVNTVRIRVWNDPFDEKGNGYGGGNCDVDTAVEIGRRATKYGMGSIIDFHYSDFWADPSKQMCPKAWTDMTVDEKADALYDYTYESLEKILSEGIKVTMVQVGNETTTGMSGETKWSDISVLMNAGSKAIRELSEKYNQDILIAVHFTNPETVGAYSKFARMMDKYSIDYDVFASSYYPMWHGTLENLTEVLSEVASEYSKKVMVAEISYPYTFDDGDGFSNSIGSDTNCAFPYSITVQGQADAIRDCAAAVAEVGEAGIGICYWEPAWIPVPGANADERSILWQKYGSGWASSFSSEYDPDDAGKYYGGSSWDNQALFDCQGHPLASLGTFRFLKTGAQAELSIDSVPNPSITVRIGNEVELPETIPAKMNDGSEKELPVTWKDSGNSFDSIGTFTVEGIASDGEKEYNVICTVKIVELNYIENYSFEEDDLSMWSIEKEPDTTTELFVIDKTADAVTGTKSVHFYSSAGGVDFTVEQEVKDLKPGTYKFSIVMHGGDADEQDIEIYAIADGVTYTAPVTITNWSEYKYPVIDNIVSTDGIITVGARVKSNTGSWGNLDDFILAPSQK